MSAPAPWESPPALPPRPIHQYRRLPLLPYHRAALTLFELLLVLSLLVILAGMSMPAVQGAFANARLRHGADQLRSAWSRARLASLETGVAHAFRCVWSSEQFHIQSQSDEVLTGGVPPVEIETEQQSERITFSKNRLTEGVVFVSGWWTGVSTRSPAAGAIEQQARTGEWSDPIMFYADGTTSDASVILENSHGHRMRVTLRGLTGVSVAGDATSEEALR